MIRAAEGAARNQQLGWKIDLQTGGAQTLAWRIESGDIPDLYIASSIEMAQELIPKPARIDPWLRNPLVVIARADDPDPVLRSDRALERSNGPVAVGGAGTQLGEFARLAMRYAEIWPLVERRTTQRTDAANMIEALQTGEVDLAIVFSSDAVQGGPDLLITQRLELPEGVQIVYTRASFSELGTQFAQLLLSPESIEQARESGYLPFAVDPEPGP